MHGELTIIAAVLNSAPLATIPPKTLFKRPQTKPNPGPLHWPVAEQIEKEKRKKQKSQHKLQRGKEWRETTQRPKQAIRSQTFTEEEQSKPLFEACKYCTILNSQLVEYREAKLHEKYANKIGINMDFIRRLAQWLRAQHDLSHGDFHKVIHFWASKSAKDIQLYFMVYFDDDYDPTGEEYPLLREEEILA